MRVSPVLGRCPGGPWNFHIMEDRRLVRGSGIEPSLGGSIISGLSSIMDIGEILGIFHNDDRVNMATEPREPVVRQTLRHLN